MAATRRPRKQVEKSVQMNVVKWLYFTKNSRKDFTFHHSPNEFNERVFYSDAGSPSQKNSRKIRIIIWLRHMVNMGTQWGEPDLRIDSRGGGVKYFEFKAPKGALNDNQKKRFKELAEIGNPVTIIETDSWIDAAVQICQVLGWPNTPFAVQSS